nr:unnamed protein product [Callosobruchus analis]
MIEEVQRRQEILKSELKKEKEIRKNSENDDDFDSRLVDYFLNQEIGGNYLFD